ncbi:MAG TPA: hypothetical protein DCL99_06445 [Firmicutes bacterium]|nr:hypothetical protein [Bacillota bacterium]
MTKRLTLLCLLAGMLALAPAVWAQGQSGTLEITGVPADVPAGRYDRQAGVFSADMSAIEGALVHVTFEEVKIVGQTMEWRTDDDYLIFTGGATLTKEDFTVTGDTLEYFGKEKKLHAVGSVVVVTDDATVYANELVYDEETDEAVFTGQVKVVFDDGVLEGEKFVMFLEKSELQFFGAFQGTFETD